MLLTIVLTLTVSTLAVLGDDDPNACPVPKPLETFKPESFQGVWYDLFTEDPEEAKRRCIQNKVEVTADKHFLIASRYVDSSGTEHTQEEDKQATPYGNQTATYSVATRESDGSYSSDGWTYVFLATINDGESYLEYSCNKNGSVITKIYHIRSRKPTISRKNFRKFREISKKDGDDKTFLQIDQHDCKYTF